MKVGIKTHMVLPQQDLYTIHIGPAKIASLVKYVPNEKLSVQHAPTGNDRKFRYRIDISFNKIGWMELTSVEVLIANIFEKICRLLKPGKQ